MSESAQTRDVDTLLLEHLAPFVNDPYGFVMNAFEWGKGELEKSNGPEEWQKDELIAIRDGLKSVDEVIQIATASGHGVGKMHSYDCIVPTPAGMTRWGDLKEGDYVFGCDGMPTRILKTTHYTNVPMYRVTFDDGTHCDVSSGHLWTVKDRNGSWQTLETIKILEKGLYNKKFIFGKPRWSIPTTIPVFYLAKDVPIHPYLLGKWFKSGPELLINTEQMIENFVRIGLGNAEQLRSPERREINKLLSAPVNDRFIPDEYKFNCYRTRLYLLQGICDEEGIIIGASGVLIANKSERMARDITWLARSLGFTACFKEQEVPFVNKKNYGVYIEPNQQPFLNNKKRNKFRLGKKEDICRYIESIKPIPNADGMCITIENQDGLYLANDFIVTHNSSLVSWLILWGLSTFEDTRGVVTANTETQLRTKTWPELQKWYNLFIAKHWFVMTATSIYSADKNHEKTWRMDCIPWSENKTESFAGLHNKGRRIIVIFDEASAIPNIIWEVTEGALTDEGTQIIWAVFGNPTRNTGRFKECFNKLRHRWINKRVDSRSVSLTNKQQIQQWIEDYGEDSDFVKIRVSGNFPNAGDRQFIAEDVVKRARGKFLRQEQYNFAPIIIGVDPQWSGADEGVVYLRQGLMSKKLFTYRSIKDDFIIAGHIARLEDEYRADAVFIDLGYGTGIYSAGKQLGRNWRLVGFGEKPNDIGMLNKRAEMWNQMKLWLQDGGAIEDDDIICDELLGPEAYVVATGGNAGKVFLESKEDMKKRGIASPNRADALALTFSYPVLSKSQRQFHKLSATQNRKYDPLSLNTDERRSKPYDPLSPIAVT